MKFKLFVLIIIVFTGLAFSQDKTVTYIYDETTQGPDYNIKISHLNVFLEVFPFQRTIDGKATFTFTPYYSDIDSLSFILSYEENPRKDDYPEKGPWAVHQVLLDNDYAEYEIKGQKLQIRTKEKLIKDKTYNLKIEYTVSPVPPVGIYFVGWDDARGIKRKQVWAHRPFGWLPYYDCRLTTDMFVTVDSTYKVYTNGERKQLTHNYNGTNTWYYKMEKKHPFFSTALVIGEYEYKTSQTYSGVPLEFWYYPDMENHVEPTYRYTEKMFEFFDSEMEFVYPYPLYREVPVIDYLYGAMETTTSTVYGDYLFVDSRGYLGRNYVNVNAHELSHQWFGNYLSHFRSKDVWLTESFATYFGKIFEKYIFGEDYYQNEKNNEAVRAFSASEKDNFAIGTSKAGSDRWYPKGSLVLDMLSYVLGDEGFKASIKKYLETNKNAVVETSDFLKAVREATGKSMEWFFDEWIYRGGEPNYKVSYKYLEEKKETLINVTQIHDTSALIKYFKMPVVIEVHYEDGSFDSAKVWNSEKEQEYIIPNDDNKKIFFVLFDPGRQILKKVTFEKTFEELSAQALNAVNLLDRYDALFAMRGIPNAQKIKTLQKCFAKERHHLMKSEIIYQISKELSTETNKEIISRIYEILRTAIYDDNAAVRKAVLLNLTAVPKELKNDCEALLRDSAYYNVEFALNNLTASFPEETEKYLNITKEETGWRGINIRVKWLEVKLKYDKSKGADISKSEFMKELIDYSSMSYEFETRINALMSLKNLNYLNEEIAYNILEAYLNFNYKLYGAAKTVFDHFYAQSEFKMILEKIYKERVWTKAGKKTLKQLVISNE
jgi:aminopeptidase N